MAYELAQANIGRLAAPPTSPQLTDLVDALHPVNALADAAPAVTFRETFPAEGSVSEPGHADWFCRA